MNRYMQCQGTGGLLERPQSIRQHRLAASYVTQQSIEFALLLSSIKLLWYLICSHNFSQEKEHFSRTTARIKHNLYFNFSKMPNETCESLVREICVHSSELVTFVQSHSKEANQLSLCIEIAPRTMCDVMGEDDLIWLPVELRKGRSV